MTLHLVFVGKTSFSDIDAGIHRYLDRLRHYVSVEVHVIKAEKISPHSAEDTVRQREGERILKLVEGRGRLVVWDVGGREVDSPGLARCVDRWRQEAVSEIWMVIGGPLGISPKVLERADALLSLSRLTFPHDLARLILVEQLYRACTLLKGEPYHK